MIVSVTNFNEERKAAAMDLLFEFADAAESPNDVMLAGGFMRDVRNNRPVKDYDFVWNGRGQEIVREDMRSLLAKYGMSLVSGEKAYHSEKGNHFRVYGRRKSATSLVPDVQLIECKVPPHQFLEDTFDFGLCQIGIDPFGELWYSNAYERDEDERTLSLLVRKTITPYQLGYALRDHLPRLQSKYTGYNFKLVQDADYELTKLRRRS